MGNRLLALLGWREWPVLLGLALPAAALWAFIELADEVIEGTTIPLDRAILLAFRSAEDSSDPLGPAWFEEMMRDFTALGGFGVLTLITVGAAGYLILEGKHRAAVAVLVAVGGGITLSTLVKLGLDRPRPDLVPHGTYVGTASFPSGHSMMAAVVYLTLAAMLVRLQPSWRIKLYLLGCAVLVTLLVGLSRVYLGVHWPTDVLAGWTIGAGWALACWRVSLLLQRQGKIEADDKDLLERGQPRRPATYRTRS